MFMKNTGCCKGAARTLALAGLICGAMGADGPVRFGLDLNGTWQFRLDSESSYGRSIQVPGCWQAQGVGNRSGGLRNHFAGTAWYQKSVSIPQSWAGKRINISIGGALRTTELFVNEKPAGRHDGMSAPFEFDVSDFIRPGAVNVIALKISNPVDPPAESPDKQTATQPTGMLNYIGNWGGIYGPVELRATGRVWIADTWVRSDVDSGIARLGITVRNSEHKPFAGRMRVAVGSREGTEPVRLAADGVAEVEVKLPMRDAPLWSPEHPNLLTAEISLADSSDTERDRIDQRFGFREIKTQGSVLLLNGKPLYLRGYGDDNVEVLTGVPPASKETYLKRLRLAREFGFNAVRFHSMTPVREFFDAADEVGILVLSELPVVYTQYLLPFKDFLRNELTSVVLAHRNHPSWLSLALGNEFNLGWIKDDAAQNEFRETVAEFYRLAKSMMPDRLVLSNDGLRLEPTDVLSLGRSASTNHPVIRHEFGGYYCSLPDVSLIPKFTGIIVPTWLEAKNRWVAENRLAAEYPIFVRNSQKLLQLGRKFQIERVRRESDNTGYEYWLIVDYPGGTGEGDSWEEGWFDYFWQPKGISAQEGREVNSAVLPLIDAGPGARTMWAEDARDLKLLVSNYGERDIVDGASSWRLNSDGRTVAESHIEHVSARLGEISPAFSAHIGPVDARTAQQLELGVDIDGHANRWSFWAFPKRELLKQANAPVVATVGWPGLAQYFPFVRTSTRPAGQGLLITPMLDDTAMDFLQSGGRVWLALDKPGDVTFFPAAGGALGTLVRDHPALKGFPHQGFCDLQFYSLLEHATPFALDRLPNLTPIIGGIRTKAGFLSKTKDLSKVGYAFEAKVGEGRLLVTTLRMQLDDGHPEAVFLCDRLLRYCDSSEFHPQAEITADQLRKEIAEYLR
jgi:hypothetical protein